MTPGEAVARYEAIGDRVSGAVEQAMFSRPLASPAEVMAPLALRHPDQVAERVTRVLLDEPTIEKAAVGLVHSG